MQTVEASRQELDDEMRISTLEHQYIHQDSGNKYHLKDLQQY
jgi:hypothetical protein